jgi:hypothetical protein
MACLLEGIQFFLVSGSIWNTCALVVNMGCSLEHTEGENGVIITASDRCMSVITENTQREKGVIIISSHWVSEYMHGNRRIVRCYFNTCTYIVRIG